ncbi:PDZ domain-containing RING finger protein 4 isoform X2 [Neocloeon triangulifer]|uniref:PDZ domain-containing RING finger protein 4 isoform X2 n=1 Tax=Neocloeon triangulifer TaxID=2078957 RepID=UPI00286F53CA|nr:PDZ domain-containing RING finger protein 4 isoform X2 [Neocloeon triangulifer]
MDFVITKVNGQDITEHSEALRAFETSPEPILVEVRRSGSSCLNSLMSTAVQTDDLDRVIYEIPECELDDDDDEIEFLLNDSLDYEVVTLNKCKGEPLGLNLTFSNLGEAEDEAASKCECLVFIESVAKDGVADKDGRVRAGDQVLQVNGVSVTSQQQASGLFAETESLNEVTLLVSRFAAKDLDDYDLVSTSFIIKSGEEDGAEEEEEKSDESCDPNIINKSTESKSEKSEEAKKLAEQRLKIIDQQLSALSKKMAVITLDSTLPWAAGAAPEAPSAMRPFGDSENEHIYETISEASDAEPIYSLPYEPGKSKSVSREVWVDVEPPRKSPSSDKEKDSSSAYNTGESCRSIPLTLDLNQPKANVSKSPSQQHQNDSGFSCDRCRQCMGLSSLESPSKEKSRQLSQKEVPNTMYTNAANLQRTIQLQQEMFRQAITSKKQTSPKCPTTPPRSQQQPLPPRPTNPVYCPPNLSNYQFVSGYGVVRCNSTGRSEQRPQVKQQEKTKVIEEEPVMIWKVKRKADGTRYITRRPVRNKILQERAHKISEERAGLTTDDDTMSELKIGRYWNKEERKKHLERAKERRKRQEAVIREKEEAKQGKSKTCSAPKRREQQTRCPPTAVIGCNKMGGILSVTTV